jgi:hypothetical protein
LEAAGMNNINVITRAGEIGRAAKRVARAARLVDMKQLDLEIDVIEVHLQAIRAEMTERPK